MPIMMHHATPAQGHPRDVLFNPSPTITAPVEHHWFVPDDTGTYCQACNLPRANRRHVARAA